LVIVTLRSISDGTEAYASANHGVYPMDETSLTGSNPPYLAMSYCGKTTLKYTYNCSFTKTGYTITATPDADFSNTQIFTITTRGILTPDQENENTKKFHELQAQQQILVEKMEADRSNPDEVKEDIRKIHLLQDQIHVLFEKRKWN